MERGKEWSKAVHIPEIDTYFRKDKLNGFYRLIHLISQLLQILLIPVWLYLNFLFLVMVYLSLIGFQEKPEKHLILKLSDDFGSACFFKRSWY